MIEGFDIVDLTQLLNENIPTWTGECGFHKTIVMDYPKDAARVMKYSFVANAGTHIDSPSHFIAGGRCIHELLLDKDLCVPIHCVDVSTKACIDYRISLQDVEEYEKVHGKMQPGAVLLGRTGWDQYWNDPIRYRSADKDNNIRCPRFAPEVADFVLERKLVGLGIDTFSPDGGDMSFPIHVKLLGAGKYLIENLTNLGKIPPVGAYLQALPMHIEMAAESPIRAIALIPKLI
jgi:kynurenine formamidase